MPDFATVMAIDAAVSGAPSAGGPPAAAAAPASSADDGVIDVGGAAPLQASAPTMASTLQPDGTHRIVVDPDDPAYAQYAGQVMGVSAPQFLPKGIVLPRDATYPITIKFSALPQPQSFPVVSSPAEASEPVVPAPAAVVLPSVTPKPGPAAAAPTVAPATTPASAIEWRDPALAAKMATIDAALASPSKVAPPASPPATATATPNAPKPPLSGMVANAAAGGNDAVASTLGAPVDLTTGALNLGIRGINAAARATGLAPQSLSGLIEGQQPSLIQPIQNPVGGSEWFKSAMGLIGADPRNVQPATPGQQLMRAAAGGATSAVLPMGVAGRLEEAASPVVSAIGHSLGGAPATTAASGAAAGVGGAIASDAAPDWAKPYANIAGQVAGGLAGSGASAGALLAARGVRGAGAMVPGSADFVRDAGGAVVQGDDGSFVTTRANALARRNVARRLAEASGMSPQDLAASIPAASDALVPGSAPTLGAATGNQGLLLAERLQRAKNRDPFAARDAAQNSARLARLRNLSPENAQAEAAGDYVHARLAQIDAEADAHHAELQSEADRHAAAAGGEGDAAAHGGALAGQVRARFAPAVAVADRAVGDAEQRLAGAADAIGGSVSAEGGRTARQAEGASLRERINTALAGSKAAVSRLYAAIDPEGRLNMEAGTIKRQAELLRAEIEPGAGDELSAREEKLIAAAERMPAVVPFRMVQSFRRNLRTAISQAMREGDGQAVRRLTILKKEGVDLAISDAVEQAARREAPGVLSGERGPDDAVMGRLAGEAAESGAHGLDDDIAARVIGKFAHDRAGQSGSDAGAERARVGVGGVGRGSAGAGAGSGEVGASGAGGANQPARGRLGNGAGNPSLARGAKPENLTAFIIRHGGIQDQGGELRHMGITNRTHPTLVRKDGVPPDRIREMMIEGGFLPHDSPNSPNNSSTNDVFDMLAEEASGRKQYRSGDAAELQMSAAQKRQMTTWEHAVDEARGHVLDHLDEQGGEDNYLPSEWLEAAAKHVAAGEAVGKAVHDAQTGWAHETQEADYRQRGLAPGVAPAATQGDLGVATGSRLLPNLDEAAAERHSAAVTASLAHHQQFGGLTENTLERGTEGSQYVVPDSAVLPRFFKANGKTSDAAGAAQALIRALGSREAAAESVAGEAARDLRASSALNGEFKASALDSWLKNHSEALAQFPEIAQRFNTVARAQKALDGLRVQRDALEQLNPVARGQTGAETMAQFVQKGPKGGDAADAYLRASGGTPDAVATFGDALTHTLRRDAMKDGDLDPRKFETWRTNYSAALAKVPGLADKLSNFAAARQAVADAAAEATAARRAYVTSAARHYLSADGRAVDPQAAVGAIMSSRTGPVDAADLVHLMRGDAAALEGLRLNFADWLMAKARSTAEAGTSGEKTIAAGVFQKIIADPKTSRVLSNVFTPEQLQIIRDVGVDLERGARWHNATKMTGGPGTAADHYALNKGRAGHEIGAVVGAEVGGDLVAAALHLHGVPEVATRAGALGLRALASKLRTAGIEREDDLMTQAILHPEVGRVLVQMLRAKSPSMPMVDRFGGVLGNLALAGAPMPRVPNFVGQGVAQ